MKRHHKHRIHRRSKVKLSAKETFFHSKEKRKERARLQRRNEYREYGNSLLRQTLGGNSLKRRKSY